MKKFYLSIALLGALAALPGQEPSVIIKITRGDMPKIAVPDFRGSGGAETQMGAFNDTLFSDLQNSGLFEMVAKSMYPLQVPQRPEDFRQPSRAGASSMRRRARARSSTRAWRLRLQTISSRTPYGA